MPVSRLRIAALLLLYAGFLAAPAVHEFGHGHYAPAGQHDHHDHDHEPAQDWPRDDEPQPDSHDCAICYATDTAQAMAAIEALPGSALDPRFGLIVSWSRPVIIDDHGTAPARAPPTYLS